MGYTELVKTLRNRRVCIQSDGDLERDFPLMLQAADAIEHLTKAVANYAEQACENETRWIPVTERLPGEDGQYVVYLKAPDEWEFPAELSYVTKLEFDKAQMLWVSDYNSYNAVIDAVNNDYKVTHWMPLPTPPKEKQS